MDKWQAQDTFWSSFGIPAYDKDTVPQTAVLPYITYESVSASLGVPQMVTASLWYRSRSWTQISQKTDEIAQQIYNMPPAIAIADGRLKVRLPSNMAFGQRKDDPSDDNIRRMVLNVEMEFLTAY